MPVREKAEVEVLPMFMGRMHESMGQTLGAHALTEEEFWNGCDFVNELYVALIEGIDFNRVILEAGGMCSKKQDEDPDHQPKVQALYKHDSLIEDHNPEFNMEMSFCADCFRLCILRMQKHEVMHQADVEGTLPDERAPALPWPMPEDLAERMAELLKERKERWDK